MNEPQELLLQVAEQLQDESHLGILLAAQMGGTPEEIQIVLQVAEYSEEADGIRPTSAYVIRCLGVREQRLSLGLFNAMAHVQDHPLLWNHNFPYKQIYFRGETDTVDALMLELNQLYGQFYGPFRNLVDDINRTMSLERLLQSGHGLLGEMPEPMAERVKRLMERYEISVRFIDTDQDVPPMQFQLLVMDDSFIVAQAYSIEPMQGKTTAG